MFEETNTPPACSPGMSSLSPQVMIENDTFVSNVTLVSNGVELVGTLSESDAVVECMMNVDAGMRKKWRKKRMRRLRRKRRKMRQRAR